MIWRTRFSSLAVSTRPQNETVSSKCFRSPTAAADAVTSRVGHPEEKVQRNLTRLLYGANGQSPDPSAARTAMPPSPSWHPPCSRNPHEPPNCLLFRHFAPRAVPIGHTRVTLRHHWASAESLAIIEDSRSIRLAPTTFRMKCISIFLLSAAAVCAADFTTGQAARLVIGQTTFTSQDSNSSDIILGAASGIAYA